MGMMYSRRTGFIEPRQALVETWVGLKKAI